MEKHQKEILRKETVLDTGKAHRDMKPTGKHIKYQRTVKSKKNFRLLTVFVL